ncbi:TFIIB-type zinc ribbon-containing protein [Andreprevotia chitinilytica]|uniref:TFIIB-type zinc ribbon-containing protein n=1 Tax=Andreprevotia chitinilytica TaxID=396808 RepID=UPI00055911EE|nr:zf-TFIIB domain-containing protein [Andreprevotia chitinilytica]
MDCPVCKTTQLVMSERQGVEIDYCPQCRGVWLDRGELDKILERSQQEAAQSYAPAPQPQAGYGHGHHGQPQPGYRDDRQYGHDQKPYRKKSIWQEIFD